MTNLLSLKFWLNLRPGLLSAAYLRSLIIFVIILASLTVIFGFIHLRNKKNLYSRFWSSLYYFNLTNTIIGLFLLFFNYEMVPFLSARFWFLLWGTEVLVWLVLLVKILFSIPKRRKQLAEEKQFKKYIP